MIVEVDMFFHETYEFRLLLFDGFGHVGVYIEEGQLSKFVSHDFFSAFLLWFCWQLYYDRKVEKNHQ